MNHSSRRNARKNAIQALYSWQISKNSIYEIEKYFFLENKLLYTDIAYFRFLFYEVSKNTDKLDTIMKPYVSRSIKNIDFIEKNILRIAIFEFMQKKIPYKIVINEAIELAKIFGSEKSYAFINGVLDKIHLILK
ncbi:transcription antitermination factor NusB [bacterium endosymbiont of Pedicinus badii]|uniref:transcription antitermination factor NusB n=1 Tax=bacterium endosymbiont of Pedicinus badii TaxID=1719126 RepID=UPI0009BBD865|nr:transcription antitermination factor NusB [bacterium endosymbiont of Pedicinus badii]OQM34286.1 hypothetical protein AOQ89_00080 [bacterium endosymbiont of Pedicinus badii]